MDQFVMTPSSSDVDLLIEKFRVEVSRSNGEGSAESRKLTVTSSAANAKTTEVNNNIDTQITDLETLIRKLQDEISEMYQNTNKEVTYTPIVPEDLNEVHRDLSNETIIIDDESENNAEINNASDTMKGKHSKECFESKQYSQVFPVMVRDVILPFDGSLKTFGHTVADVLTMGTNETENLSINQEIMDDWNDFSNFTPNVNLEDRIDELQAEISEKMETIMESNKCEDT